MVGELIFCWCAGRLRATGWKTAGTHHEQIPGGRTGSASGNTIYYNIIILILKQGWVPGWYLYSLLLPAVHTDAHRHPDVGAVQAEPDHLEGAGGGEEKRNEEIK